LIDGEIYEMAPIGDGHIGDIIDLTHVLVRRVGDRALVSVQNSIRLDDVSEPEPDIALLRPRERSYREGKAGPQDVLLIIEVADTSLVPCYSWIDG